MTSLIQCTFGNKSDSQKSFLGSFASVCWRTDGFSLLAYPNRSRSLDKPLLDTRDQASNLFLVPYVLAKSG
jgi:hypothetical protein